MSPFTNWTVPAGITETFCLGDNSWNVNEAKRILIATPRKSHMLQVADWKGICDLADPKDDGVAVDLAVPVICIRFGRGYLPIDGWNRIREALRTGITDLPCVRLTLKEARKIRS